MADGDDADAAVDRPAPTAVTAGLPAWLVDPSALLPLALLAIVVFGGLHLLADLIAFTGGFVDQLGGILTDATTIMTGVVLAVGFTAVTRSPLPGSLRSRRIVGWVDGVRSDPSPAMRRLLLVFVAIAAAHALVAFIDRIDGASFLSGLRLLTHDVAFLATIVGVVVALTAVAIDRVGRRDWPDASRARDLAALALYGAPSLAIVAALLTLIDEAGDDARAAFMISTFLLIQACAAAAILVVATIVVRSRFPPDDGDDPGVPLRGIVASAVETPGRFLSPLIGVTTGVGVLHVLLATAEHGEYSDRLGAVGFFNSVFDVVALVMIVVVVRALAVAPSTVGLVDGPQPDESDVGRTLGRTTYAVAYLGVLSALVSAWAFRGLGSEVWYWFSNRLVRTAIVLAVLLGLGALRAERAPAGAR